MELKFRAWDKQHKEMEQCHDLYWFEENGVHDSSGEGHNSSYVIMPWIGKYDKNGKEIYEGDIVKREAYIDYEEYSKVNKIEGVIEIYNYSWCIVYKEEDKRYIHPLFMEEEFCNINELEVIGNVYEGVKDIK